MIQINNTTERYDFTVNEEIAGSVPEELDRLTNKQILAVHGAIQAIKQDSVDEAITRHMEWFNNGILPVLKQFAEQTASILDVEREQKGLIQAALRNPCGLEISSDSLCLIMAIMAAVDLCQYFGHKKLKVYADFSNSSSSFCCGVI